MWFGHAAHFVQAQISAAVISYREINRITAPVPPFSQSRKRKGSGGSRTASHAGNGHVEYVRGVGGVNCLISDSSPRNGQREANEGAGI